MDWELSQFGLGDSLDTETVVIAVVAVFGIACLGPLLAMGGRRGKDEAEGGHPLRSSLYDAGSGRTANGTPKRGR